jgi:Mn-dependent DtxR family transcriptional regulator
METITDTEQEIAQYCADYLRINDQFPPTRKIEARFGIAQSSVVWHFKSLERKGIVERNENGKWRFVIRPREF